MTEVNDFAMPFVIDADEAAARIIRALAKAGKKVFNFPAPTAFLVKARPMGARLGDRPDVPRPHVERAADAQTRPVGVE